MPEEIKNKETKTKRIIWLVIILLLLLIIAAIIYLLLFYYKVQPTPVRDLNYNADTGPFTPDDLPKLDTFNTPDVRVLADYQGINGAQQPSSDEKDKVDAELIANAFAERFGSYSNQGNFANFDDLSIFMTKSMSDWVKTHKASLQNQHSDFNVYYALETKAISNQIIKLDTIAGQVEILIKTQRQEFENDLANPRVFYQDINLKLVKDNGDWKVNGAYWQ